jgi:NitT/TauT family transport system ATP-binding protein
MPQTPILIPFRTGLENALFGIETIRPVQPADIEAAWELLRRLRLPPELGVPGALSGGMRRRAALAQAILSDRKLMVLDEALAGLDYDNRLAVEDELWRATSHGRGCLLASHDVDSVVALADRVIVLKPPQPAKAVMLDIASGFAPESQAPSKRRRTKDFPKLVVRLQRELWETAA